MKIKELKHLPDSGAKKPPRIIDPLDYADVDYHYDPIRSPGVPVYLRDKNKTIPEEHARIEQALWLGYIKKDDPLDCTEYIQDLVNYWKIKDTSKITIRRRLKELEKDGLKFSYPDF